MDVDSTLVQGEAIDLLAAEAGVGAEVAALTEQAMRGTIDFADALRERVALLAGLEESAISRAYDDLPLAPGARTLVRTLTRLGYRFALVSGGFGHHHGPDRGRARDRPTASNELEISNGRLTGRLVGPSSTRTAKRSRCAGSQQPKASAPSGRWRSATAPTTWRCWPPRASVSRSTPSRLCASTRMQPSACRTSTP